MYTLLIAFAADAAEKNTSTNYEQLAKVLNTVSLVTFILAVAFLAFGIFCFIKFRIPRIIGDLSGRTARKSIEQMRAENEKSGKKSFRPHPVAADRGPLTDQIKQSGKIKKDKAQKSNKSAQQPNLEKGVGSGATDVLEDLNATEKLDYDENGTEILNDGTQVLSNEQINSALNKTTVGMKMIQDIMFIHTDEVI